MHLQLHIWRQPNRQSSGKMIHYELDNVSEHMSFWKCLMY